MERDVILNHEGTSCPFGGMTIAYIGNQDTFSTYDRQTGTLTVHPGAAAGSVPQAGRRDPGHDRRDGV